MNERRRSKGEFHYGWQKLCIISRRRYFLITNFFQLSTQFWTPLKFHKRQNAKINSPNSRDPIFSRRKKSSYLFFHALYIIRSGWFDRKLLHDRWITQDRFNRIKFDCLNKLCSEQSFFSIISHFSIRNSGRLRLAEDAWIGRRGDGQKNSFDVG